MLRTLTDTMQRSAHRAVPEEGDGVRHSESSAHGPDVSEFEPIPRAPRSEPVPKHPHRGRPGSDFRVLYQENFDFVWRTFRRLGLPEVDCFDAAQEAFLTIERKLSTFEERSSLRTWIFGICVGIARNRRRSIQRANRLRGSDSALERAEAPSVAVDEELSLHEARRMLEHILDGMSPSLRAAFVMFEIEQISAEEIARTLGVPAPTVRSRVRLAREHYDRAIKRLRASLKEDR